MTETTNPAFKDGSASGEMPAPASSSEPVPAAAAMIPATSSGITIADVEAFQWRPSKRVEIRLFARTFANARELLERVNEQFDRNGGVPPQRQWRAVGKEGTPIAPDEFCYINGLDIAGVDE